MNNDIYEYMLTAPEKVIIDKTRFKNIDPIGLNRYHYQNRNNKWLLKLCKYIISVVIPVEINHVVVYES